MLLAGIGVREDDLAGRDRSQPFFYDDFRMMSPGDVEALPGGEYRPFDEKVLLTAPLNGSPAQRGFPFGLVREGYRVEMAWLRNPGELVYAVFGNANWPLNDQRRNEIADEARKLGITLVVNDRVAISPGPDGRTPVIMKNIRTYSTGVSSLAKKTLLGVEMSFSQAEQARRAAKYIDASVFKVVQIGPKLTASCMEAADAASDEWDAFDRMASRFGGKVTSVSTSLSE